MSAKLGFAAGLAVGVLAGSRAGRGVYDRTAAAATAVAQDPRVRSGASAALHKAGSAGTSVAGAAARKVRARKSEGDGEGDGTGRADGAESDRGNRVKGELRKRGKRFTGGVRKHGVRVDGHGNGIRNSHSHRWGQLTHLDHWNHSRHAAPQADHSGMSAPSVQARPKGEGGRADQAPSTGEA